MKTLVGFGIAAIALVVILGGQFNSEVAVGRQVSVDEAAQLTGGFCVNADSRGCGSRYNCGCDAPGLCIIPQRGPYSPSGDTCSSSCRIFSRANSCSRIVEVEVLDAGVAP